MKKSLSTFMAVVILMSTFLGFTSLWAAEINFHPPVALTPDEIELCWYLAQYVDGSGYDDKAFRSCCKILSSDE